MEKSRISKLILDVIYHNHHQNKKTYCEPFVGSGAVFFEILNVLINDDDRYFDLEFNKFIINDINENLINCYLDIQNNIYELLKELNLLSTMNTKEDYERLKSEFNKSSASVKKSALFIYLNKTCYRGMYRVNKKNEFNVPYGNYKTIDFDYQNLINISIVLNKFDVTIMKTDYKDLIDFQTNITYNTVYYLDPPYYDTFNDYSPYGFDYKMFDCCLSHFFINELNHHNNLIVLSNSLEFKSFWSSLPSEFIIEYVKVNDLINSKKPNNERTELLMYSKSN